MFEMLPGLKTDVFLSSCSATKHSLPGPISLLGPRRTQLPGVPCLCAASLVFLGEAWPVPMHELLISAAECPENQKVLLYSHCRNSCQRSILQTQERFTEWYSVALSLTSYLCVVLCLSLLLSLSFSLCLSLSLFTGSLHCHQLVQQ